MAAALAALDPANRDAWALFRRLVIRLAGDLGAGGVVLARLTSEMSLSEFEDMWHRLSILYDAICPVPQPPQES